jgi:RHS repeat-associated protein
MKEFDDKENTQEVLVTKALDERPIYFYHPDHLGTTNALTDANGTMYQFFLNLPFGESMAEQNSQSYYKTPFKFNGKELDESTGLYYYGARYYDPSLSIWMSVDPLAEEFPNFSPYNYTMNNPINMVDPDGRAAQSGKDVYELNGNSGDICLIEKNNDKTDTLKAQNGDVIAKNVKKGILKDNINIAQDGLNVEGDVEMNFHVGNMLSKLSLYEQKEISWGFYAENLNSEGTVEVLPYQYNKYNKADAPSKYNSAGTRLAVRNHTHPGFYEFSISGWRINPTGGTTPSGEDYSGASQAKYGNIIWGRAGLNLYNSSGSVRTPNSDKGLMVNYRSKGRFRDLNYVKNVLKWKKEFSMPGL